MDDEQVCRDCGKPLSWHGANEGSFLRTCISHLKNTLAASEAAREKAERERDEAKFDNAALDTTLDSCNDRIVKLQAHLSQAQAELTEWHKQYLTVSPQGIGQIVPISPKDIIDYERAAYAALRKELEKAQADLAAAQQLQDRTATELDEVRHDLEYSAVVEQALRAVLEDALSGWRYIRKVHGDLPGVGWDRVEQSVQAALFLTPSEAAAKWQRLVEAAADLLDALRCTYHAHGPGIQVDFGSQREALAQALRDVQGKE